MKKRILIGILSISLLPQVVSAGKAENLRDGLRAARSFSTDTAQDAWRLLTLKNLALLGVGYYVGLPTLNRIRTMGNQILACGNKMGYGVGYMSSLITWFVSWPDWVRRKIDPTANTVHVPVDYSEMQDRVFGKDADDAYPGISNILEQLNRHNHDKQYAALDHNHLGLAAIDHTHNGIYAPESLGHKLDSHNHDQYATLEQHGKLTKQLTTLQTQVAGLIQDTDE